MHRLTLTVQSEYSIISELSLSLRRGGSVMEKGENRDATQVRSSGSPPGKVPKRYNASVVIIEGYSQGMEYPITAEYTVIGRDKTAGIALKDQMVSRRHAAILFLDGEFKLQDLESTNGTMMNGTVIEVASIKHRDKFRIGNTTFQFILEDTKKGNTYEID